MFGKKKDKEKEKASKAESAALASFKSKIWGIESLNEDNFDSGFSFLVKSIKWLRKSDAKNVEGIFRKSGDSVRIDYLKTKIDELDFDFEYEADEDPCNVTGLLKKYFREMKEPILSTENYDAFIAVDNFHDHLRIGSLKFALSLIPQIRHSMMYELCLFLKEVSLNVEVNKMTDHNLAIVFAPNILRPKVENHLTLLTDSGHASAVVQTMIREVHEVFFGDPIDIKVENKEKIRQTMTNLYQQQHQEGEMIIEKIKMQSAMTDEDFEAKVQMTTKLIRKGQATVKLDPGQLDFSEFLEETLNNNNASPPVSNAAPTTNDPTPKSSPAKSRDNSSPALSRSSSKSRGKQNVNQAHPSSNATNATTPNPFAGVFPPNANVNTSAPSLLAGSGGEPKAEPTNNNNNNNNNAGSKRRERNFQRELSNHRGPTPGRVRALSVDVHGASTVVAQGVAKQQHQQQPSSPQSSSPSQQAESGLGEALSHSIASSAGSHASASGADERPCSPKREKEAKPANECVARVEPYADFYSSTNLHQAVMDSKRQSINEFEHLMGLVPKGRKSNVKQKMLLNALANKDINLDQITSDASDATEETTQSKSATISATSPIPTPNATASVHNNKGLSVSPRLLASTPQPPNSAPTTMPSHSHRSSAPRGDVTTARHEASLVSQLMRNLPQLPSIPQVPVGLSVALPAQSVSPRENANRESDERATDGADSIATNNSNSNQNASTTAISTPDATASLPSSALSLPVNSPTTTAQATTPARRGSLRRSSSNNELINIRAQKRRESTSRSNTACDLKLATSPTLPGDGGEESPLNQDANAANNATASSSAAKSSVTSPPVYLPRVSRGRKEHGISRSTTTGGLRLDEANEKRESHFQKIGKLMSEREAKDDEFQSGELGDGVTAPTFLSASDTAVSAKKSPLGNRSTSSSPSLRLLKQQQTSQQNNNSGNSATPNESKAEQPIGNLREREIREGGKVGRRRTDDVAKMSKLPSSASSDKEESHGSHSHSHSTSSGGNRGSSQKRKKASSVNVEHASVLSIRRNQNSSANPATTTAGGGGENQNDSANPESTDASQVVSPARTAVPSSRRLQLPRKTSGTQITNASKVDSNEVK